MVVTRKQNHSDSSANRSIADVDPQESAENVGLYYSNDAEAGVRRRKRGTGFTYTQPNGKRVTDKRMLERIKKLAIPPAYSDVWICPRPDGHIQATGRDAKGRKQYRYHALFREVRDSNKYDHMLEFAQALPKVRAQVDEHLGLRGLPREKVLATIVRLLESTMIRVGNADYAKQNKSFGLTTLLNRHVEVNGDQLLFQFKGKSGKQWRLSVRDHRVAKIVRASQELPGQHLFQYVDNDGVQREVSSGDINNYLKDISGADITAKDFRTWTGTVLAAGALAECEPVENEAAAKRNIRTVIEAVSSRLGNTPTICRKCYIHPEILASYMSQALTTERLQSTRKAVKPDLAQLRPEEAAVLAFLQRRLSEKAR